MTITYGSVCSGIEAATLAWEPLGWRAAWFAEIEKFPSSVLAHRWPDVTNFGDMTLLPMYLRSGWISAPDVLVGGTPCQAFSVAGLRQGLVDPRGQLAITFVEVANAIDEQRPDSPCTIVWENVPGVLSDKTNAFGCFLAALVGEGVALEPPGGKWSNAGCVLGPQRAAAWRVLDAQYFGVAQRRRRVFVVASAREGFDPAAVLFESEGVRRDTAPSREAGQETTCFTPSSINAYRAGIGTLRANGGDIGGGSEGLICGTLQANGKAAGSATQQDAESGMLVPCGITIHGTNKTQSICSFTDVAGSLRTKPPGSVENSSTTAILCMAHGQAGAEIRSDGSPSLTCNHEAPIVAFNWNAQPGMKQTCYVATAPAPIAWSEELTASVDCAGTIQYGGQGGRHDGVMQVIAFKPGQSAAVRSIGAQKGLACTLESGGGGNNKQAVSYGLTVRRLMPIECERLQGMPDNHTAIPGAADGPRYKAIGNSKAVPVVRWLGQRLARELRK